jgi:hypothetical protein
MSNTALVSFTLMPTEFCNLYLYLYLTMRTGTMSLAAGMPQHAGSQETDGDGR